MNIINSNTAPQGYGGGYIPPSPIGAALNIGGVGYNTGMQNMGMPNTMGGYYNPYGGSVYNPYLMRQQQERMIALQRTEQENQSNILKSLSRIVNSNMSEEQFQEHAKAYNPVYEVSEEQQHIQQYNKFSQMATYNPEIHQIQNKFARNIQLINIEIEKQKSRFPDTLTLPEYLEKSGDLLFEAFMEEGQRQLRDMSRTYSGQKYRDLIDMHSSSTSYFSTLFSQSKANPNVTIDDMEVRLPNDIQNSEYRQRQQQFVQELLKNGGITNG